VHGIQIVSSQFGYITCGGTNQLLRFDTKTLTITDSLSTGKNPDAMLFDEVHDRLFVFNNKGGTAQVVQASTGKELGNLALGGAPEAGAVAVDGTVYVNLEDKNEVVVFDPEKLIVKKRFSLGPGEEPSGIALDTNTNRLFCACGNKMLIVLDALTGGMIASLPTGEGTDGLAYDDENHLLFVPNGEGTLTIIRQMSKDIYAVVQTLPTAKGARTIGYDRDSYKLYLPTADFGAKPTPTPEHPHPRAAALPKTFRVLEVGEKVQSVH